MFFLTRCLSYLETGKGHECRALFSSRRTRVTALNCRCTTHTAGETEAAWRRWGLLILM